MPASGRRLAGELDRILCRDTRRLLVPPDLSPSLTACELTDGLPWLPAEVSERWLGRRLILWPDGIPTERRVSVVSSRMPAGAVPRTEWFDLLRMTVLHTHPREDRLCVVRGAAASAATARAADLFARRVLEFSASPIDPDAKKLTSDTASDDVRRKRIRSWLNGMMRKLRAAGPKRTAAVDDPPDRVVRAFLSFSLDGGSGTSLLSLPFADRLLFAAADRVNVLSLRDGGNVPQLIAAHATDPNRCDSPVLVRTTPNDCGARLLEQHPRLVAWLVDPFDGARDTRVPTPRLEDVPSRLAAFPENTSTPLTAPDDWLLHWTRAPRGPWPGETADDALDEQLLGWKPADRSALATLWRIVANGRLRASREGIRGQHPMVSLTEVPLSAFRCSRVFRPHRHRTDFEPWGVAIRRQAILDLGGRPVLYGSEQDWNKLPDRDRPWFQKFDPGQRLDTRSEREWRVAGDIDLLALPAGSCCLFVDSEDAAEAFRRCTPWPVIVVPGPVE